ncbi:MAG TPA: hypothetical protein VM221_00120 [Armatimonadota bacterium]|nr:hypothetical protein [Armatimonadota bacterium]
MARKLRIAVWALMGVGAVLLLLIGAAAVYVPVKARRAERDLARAMNQIAATGAPVKLTQLARPPIPDAQNAAIVYQRAFAALKLSDNDKGLLRQGLSGKSSLADPAIAERARGILQRNADALRLIHSASTMPRCDFRLDWSKGNGVALPQLGQLRMCSRLLCVESAMLLREGHVDDALAASAANCRLARAAEEPNLLGPLTEYSIIGMAVKSLADILHDSQPAASMCRLVAGDIASMDLVPSYVAALKGNRVMGISIFDSFRPSRDPLRAVAEFASGEKGRGRHWSSPRSSAFTGWWLATDELTYLQLMARVVREGSLPYRKVVTIHPRVEDSVETLPRMPPRLVTALLIPAFSNCHRARDRAIAHLGLARIALLLKAYRADHGGYPTSLEELARAEGRALPTDPFSGKPFVYRRDGAGFLIYSWGPNLKDDKGTPPPPAPPGSKRRDEGDIVMRCVQ